MEYVNLGHSGVKVSRICLGCMSFGSGADWMLDEEASRAVVRAALDEGINYFDTANIYSKGESETYLGRALKDMAPSRDQLVIATKVYGVMGDAPNQSGLSRKHIMHSIDDSLRRLGMDYVDLYQIHRFDYDTPMEETLEALTDVVKAGKARYIGASSMFAWQFAKYLLLADQKGLSRFVTMQNHYNLLYREEEREMIPLCRDQGIGVLPWSPMAQGLLAGSRDAGTPRSRSPMLKDRFRRPADEAILGAVRGIAEKRRVPPARIAIAWLLSKPEVVAPIVGASKAGHLADPVAALDIELTDEEIATLEQPYAPQEVLGHR